MLVLSGDLDTLTPPSEARAAAALFPNSTFVSVANTGHVTALDDSWECASVIVTDFIANGEAGDTTCADTIPEIRAVDRYPLNAVDATAAIAAPGDSSTVADRQIATVAVDQVGDALAQWGVMTGDNGQGLRGGTFTIDEGDTLTLHFDGAKLSDDVTVNGSATVDQTTGKVEADIDISSGEVTGTLAVSWDGGRGGGDGRRARHARRAPAQRDAARPLTRHLFARSSRSICFTTFIAGMPVTPPPPWVAEPAW